MYRRLTILLISAVIVCSVQHNHGTLLTTNGKQALPGSIDGATSPQLIPDATAYRVFFRAFTADSDPIRQQAMLLRARLSSADFAAVLQVGASFMALRNAYKAAEAQAIANAEASGVPIDQAALNALRDAIGTTVKTLLTTSLTRDGMLRFDALVQSEKRNMTIFPLPDMSGAK